MTPTPQTRVDVPVCDKPGCSRESVGVVCDANPRRPARRHPSTGGWLGMRLCWHHADVMRRVDERYQLGLRLVRWGGFPPSGR